MITRNGLGLAAEGEQFSVMNVETPNLSAILDAHVRRVEGMKRKGLTPLVRGTQQARLEAARALNLSEYGRSILRRARASAIRLFLVWVGLLIALLIGLLRAGRV